MRVGLLADVHANRHALAAVLAVLGEARVGAYVCAGDLVGYGPDPEACVEQVLDLPGAVVVAGNHDLMVTGRLVVDGLPRLAAGSLAWTRQRLSRTREKLAALPLQASVAGRLVVAHGAPGDPQRYVRTTAAARAALTAVQEPLLVLGHTHRPLAVGDAAGSLPARPGAPLPLAPSVGHVLNPGSVGQAREARPLARCAVLDLDRREVTFHAVPDHHLAVPGRPAPRRTAAVLGADVSPRLPARARRRAARLCFRE